MYQTKFLRGQIFAQWTKIGYSEKFFKWFKTKILLCKGGMRKGFAFMKFFDCLIKFWTLPYGPKAQWSISQKANFIGFK